ncbi:MAG: DUF2628 domain-containing protein [Pseudomonadota bacterium]
MATFSVHARDGVIVDPLSDVEFVRDGFSPFALVFGVLWFLWHRMWWVAGGYAGFVLMIGMVAASGFVAPAGMMLLQSLLAFAVGLHATALRRWSVERKGFAEIAVVQADDLEAAELRFFSAVGPTVAVVSAPPGRGEANVPPPFVSTS